MSPTASKIAKALNLTGAVVFATKCDGPGPAMRGWFVLEPAGRWRWLGSSARALGVA
jgi:hypothetical protein